MSIYLFYCLLFIIAALGLILGMMMADYYQFRHAGKRFTAENGTELCESHRNLAKHVGYQGVLPICDYHLRNQR